MDHMDKEAEVLLPCRANCDSKQPIESNRHAISCVYKYRHAVAAALRKRDDETNDWQKKHKEALDLCERYIGRLHAVESQLAAADASADRYMEMWGQAKAEVTELRAEIERLRTMSTVEMMCENLNINHHVIEWENRCLKAEAELDQFKGQLNDEIWKAHRPVSSNEHDALNGKLHGYCIRCITPWPCEYSPESKAQLKEAGK